MRSPKSSASKSPSAVFRAFVCAVAVALAATLGLVTAPPAQAASYALTASGAGTTTTNKAKKLTVTYKYKGKKVAKATAQLQYWNGKKWVKEKSVAIKKGTGSVSVKHAVMDRTYRFYIKGKATSKSFVVHFIPANFTIKGSGSGHGAGMPQYGAYELSREGRSAASILTTYYPGATPSRANNPLGKIRVQVLGAPADTRTTTTFTLDKGDFTLLDGSGRQLYASTVPGSVAIGVSGSLVTANVTAGGTKATLPTTSRLVMKWNNAQGTVSVAGAQGTYRYGTLEITSIQNRPNVVNVLVLNTEYLEGIDEMPASWGTDRGMEALKAQVIASRTYALREVWNDKQTSAAARKAKCDCNVYDDTRDQNFTGWKKTGLAANKPWVDAAKSTIYSVPVSGTYPDGSAVDVLRDARNNFAETPFFASTGNVKNVGTGSNADVFGMPALPYLKGVPDPYSAKISGNPYIPWKKNKVLTQAQVKKIFGADVKKLTVSATYSGGLVKTITVTTATGSTKKITKITDSWRKTLGIDSPWITSITGK